VSGSRPLMRFDRPACGPIQVHRLLDEIADPKTPGTTTPAANGHRTVDSRRIVVAGLELHTWVAGKGREWAEQVVALLPRSALVVIPGEPHAVHYTRPQLVAGIVRERLLEVSELTSGLAESRA
jgi:pimeloyl-ACP methyl ester carboxylesterase